MKNYAAVEDGYKGDIVRCLDGATGEVLYFTPGYFTTHAILRMEDGSERKELIADLTRLKQGKKK